jgi:hypothetical protein
MMIIEIPYMELHAINPKNLTNYYKDFILGDIILVCPLDTKGQFTAWKMTFFMVRLDGPTSMVRF